MTDIVFMDTECLGLDPAAPVWEFAAIRRTPSGNEDRFHCFISHSPHPFLSSLPDEFRRDYLMRYRAGDALTKRQAAKLIEEATIGATVIGAVPSFDTVRLGRLLALCGRNPEPWHYHLCDVENLVVGFLAAKGELITPPWHSNELSAAVGVDPDMFERHTAMGDAEWCQAQYDAVMRSGVL